MARLFDSQTGSANQRPERTGRIFKQPVKKQKSTAGKIISGAGKMVKETLKPATTLAVRPAQAIAAALGAPAERIDKNTKRMFGDWVAPTPKSGKDVIKDVGRGLQTVALGVPVAGRGAALGRRLAQNAAAGTAFGVGASLEQGNKLISKETGKQALGGAILGAAIPEGFTAVGRLFKTAPKTPKTAPGEAIEDIVTTGAQKETAVFEKLPDVPGAEQRVVSKAEPISSVEAPKIEAPKTPKQPKPQPMKDEEELLDYKFGDDFDDPVAKPETFKQWREEYSKLRANLSADEVSDIIFNKNKTPVSVPKTVLYELLSNEKNLTPKQRHRLVSNKFAESTAGKELVGVKLRDSSMNDYMMKKNAQLKENLKNQVITKKTTKRFLDDLEC